MDQVITQQLFDGTAIAASGSLTSKVITLNGPVGFLSLQITETGDGTGRWEAEYSNDGTDWVTPTGVSDIVTAFTKTSGPDSNGKDIYQIRDGVFAFLRIKVTETGTTDSITPTATLAVQ